MGNIAACDNQGKCQCKANVEGEKCERCKPGYFDLQPTNPMGCVPCFCYGHSDQCTSTPGYSIYLTESTFHRDGERWIAKDSKGNEVPFRYNIRDRQLEANAIYQDNPVYFYAPEKFLGDKKYAYNRNLSFTLQITGDYPLFALNDLVLEGNGISIQTALFQQGNSIPPNRRTQYHFRLNEDPEYGWSPQLSHRDFISLLSDLKAIKIKATYTNSGSGMLDDVSLETAIAAPGSGSTTASWVETCTCPLGYDGQHCDSCAAGYKHDPPRGGKFAKCVPCNCNKHGEYCDSESGTYTHTVEL